MNDFQEEQERENYQFVGVEALKSFSLKAVGSAPIPPIFLKPAIFLEPFFYNLKLPGTNKKS